MYEELNVSDLSSFPPLAAIVADQIATATRVPPTLSPSPPLTATAAPVDARHVCAPLTKDRGHVFANFPIEILVLVINQCDWKTAATWRMVSRAFFAAVASCMRRRYEALVRPYTTQISVFDSVLQRHAAIISGSTALYYFMPDISWYPNDLDIYVPDCNWRSFIRAVQLPSGLGWRTSPPPPPGTSEGAATPTTQNVAQTKTSKASASSSRTRLPPISDHLPPAVPVDSDSDADTEYERDAPPSNKLTNRVVNTSTGLRSVRRFYTSSGRRIDVICSPSNNAITPLRFFWSSAVMNFISPDACFCGFPRATLVRRGALKLGVLKPRDKAAVEKYEERGYTFGGTDYREILDMWDYLFFGERLPLFFDFRIAPESPRAKVPIRATSRGWVPTINATLPTPGQYAIIPLDPRLATLTIPSSACWILTMPLREPAYRLRLRLT